MKKSFRLGIIVGRFQSFHNGHKYMIDKALELCENVGVLIGSSQEFGTSKNPFDYETREQILKTVYGNTISIAPLPDIGAGNNAIWGDYVLRSAKEKFFYKPDLLISGKEERRAGWLDSIEGNATAELYVPKTINISASKMRELIIKNDFETWKQYCDEKLWTEYEKMREIILMSCDIKETKSI